MSQPLLNNFRVPRSTYSRKSGLQMKSYLDRCLREGRGILVPVEGSGYTLLSLRQKINDALLWLMDNYDPLTDNVLDGKDGFTKKDYEKLKLFTKIRVKEDGVLIDYNNKMLKSFPASAPGKSNMESLASWKGKLLVFLDSSKEEKLFLEDLNLTPEDILYVEKILENSGFEYSVESEFIRIIK